MVVHTGTRQLKIIWIFIQDNSEDSYEFSSAEQRALNTHTLDTSFFAVRKCDSLPCGFRGSVELEINTPSTILKWHRTTEEYK